MEETQVNFHKQEEAEFEDSPEASRNGASAREHSNYRGHLA